MHRTKLLNSLNQVIFCLNKLNTIIRELWLNSNTVGGITPTAHPAALGGRQLHLGVVYSQGRIPPAHHKVEEGAQTQCRWADTLKSVPSKLDWAAFTFFCPFAQVARVCNATCKAGPISAARSPGLGGTASCMWSLPNSVGWKEPWAYGVCTTMRSQAANMFVQWPRINDTLYNYLLVRCLVIYQQKWLLCTKEFLNDKWAGH